MRRIQIAALCGALLLSASAALAWRVSRSERHLQSPTPPSLDPAAARALLQTPSNLGIPPVPNRISIANLEGSPQNNRPVSISRFFAPSEIPPGQFAAASIAGQTLPTQCDVRTRWPDGSLQHAILTFKTSLGPAPAEVAFVPSAQTLSGPGLDAHAMLSDRFLFGATLEIRIPGADPQLADARRMLQAGLFRYWSRGPLMTQIIIEQHGADPSHDLLANAHRSIHPIFIATFFEGHPGVRVEVVSEIAWHNRLQRVDYSARILTGPPGHQNLAFDLPGFSHLARTRWRRDLWSGPALGRINVNHNLPYLIYSRIIPNYDLSRSVSKSAIDHELDYQKARDNLRGMGPGNCSRPGGSCAWYPGFGTTGGRPDIGILTRWDVRYLYTFDPRLYDVMIANANVSGHVPIHVRESASGKSFHSSASTPADANGRIVSIDARPCYVSRFFGEISCPADAPVFVGDKSMSPWAPDLAHQGSFAFVAYLVTGDWYYLEELYFWAGWNLAWANHGNCSYCRGGNHANPGVFGVVNASINIRGIAWGLRTVAHAAILAPSGSPEKDYFTEKVLNNIAAAEGRFSIRGGLSDRSAALEQVWRHGFRDLGNSMPNPLYAWRPHAGSSRPVTQKSLDPERTRSWVSAPMQNFILSVFGYIDEMGFPAGAVRRTALLSVLNQLANPAYNPYLIDEIDLPAGTDKGVFFPDWAGVLSGYKPDVQSRRSFLRHPVGETELGYGYVFLAAASFLGDLNEGAMNGRAAHKWLADRYPGLDALNANPKWALVPRSYEFKGSISAPSTWNGAFRSSARPANPR
ncbi:MAG: hypothetical protein C0504_16875 [Candidatus Solibacter sp.]|nr:hypothetical protein [Candidatus Solibacter sp.]